MQFGGLITAALRAVRADEREKCAKVAEELGEVRWTVQGAHFAFRKQNSRRHPGGEMTDSQKAWEDMVADANNGHIIIEKRSIAIIAKDAECRALTERVEKAEAERDALKKTRAPCPHSLMRRFEGGNRECVNCGERFGPLEEENAALKGQLCGAKELIDFLLMQYGPHFHDYTFKRIYALSSTSPCSHQSRLSALEKVVEAAEELVDVSDLRGDIDDIPNPCDDPKLWTARVITAWDSLRAALDALKEG